MSVVIFECRGEDQYLISEKSKKLLELFIPRSAIKTLILNKDASQFQEFQTDQFPAFRPGRRAAAGWFPGAPDGIHPRAISLRVAPRTGDRAGEGAKVTRSPRASDFEASDSRDKTHGVRVSFSPPYTHLQSRRDFSHLRGRRGNNFPHLLCGGGAGVSPHFFRQPRLEKNAGLTSTPAAIDRVFFL